MYVGQLSDVLVLHYIMYPVLKENLQMHGYMCHEVSLLSCMLQMLWWGIFIA